MNLCIEGENRTLEVYLDGKVYRKPRKIFAKDSWHKGKSWIVTPFVYLDAKFDTWERDSEQPKWSRPKRFTISLGYGHVQGYRD